MLVTLYGSLDFKDKGGLRAWIYAHSISHRQYRQVQVTKGNLIQSVILDASEVDNDWFGIHGLAHAALFPFAPSGSGLVNDLIFSDVTYWSDESKFYDWHQRHDQLHQALNAAFGIS